MSTVKTVVTTVAVEMGLNCQNGQTANTGQNRQINLNSKILDQKEQKLSYENGKNIQGNKTGTVILKQETTYVIVLGSSRDVFPQHTAYIMMVIICDYCNSTRETSSVCFFQTLDTA